MVYLLVAGCSLQDELFASFEQLLALADEKGTTYDRCEHSSSAVSAPLLDSALHPAESQGL